MMGQIIGLVIIAVLALLAAIEAYRYAQARRLPGDFPYPRRRLSRRLAISLVFIGIVAVITFWPARASLGVQLGALLAICFGLLMGLALLWRDLQETSRTAVQQMTRLNEQTGAALGEILEKNPPALRNGHHKAERDETDRSIS